MPKIRTTDVMVSLQTRRPMKYQMVDGDSEKVVDARYGDFCLEAVLSPPKDAGDKAALWKLAQRLSEAIHKETDLCVSVEESALIKKQLEREIFSTEAYGLVSDMLDGDEGSD